MKLAFAQNEVNSFLSVHVQKLFEKLAFGELMYSHFADIFKTYLGLRYILQASLRLEIVLGSKRVNL